MNRTSVPTRRRQQRTKSPGRPTWALPPTVTAAPLPPEEPTLEEKLAAFRIDHPELWQKDDWHAPLALATDLVVIVGAAVAAHLHPFGPKWLWYFGVTVPVIATRMRALATLLHEATHGALMEDRGLARWIATYGSSYLVLQTWFAYVRSHVGLHHGHFAEPDHDPDLQAHIDLGLYDHRSATGFLARRVVAPVFGVDHPRMIAELLRSRAGNLTDPRARAEVLRMLAWTGSIMAVVAWTVGVEAVLLYWLVPVLYGFPLANWYAELAEHFPFPKTREGAVHQTRERATGPITQHLIGIHGEGHHWVHHWFSKMPYWKQTKALRLMRQEIPEVEELLRSQGSDRWRPFGLLRQYAAAGREVARWNRDQSQEA